VSDEKPEALLKSALEKIVYFEARASQLTNDAGSSRDELERTKNDLSAASQREIELRRVIAELEVRATRAHAEREEMARLVDALRRERAELIGKMLDASRIHGIDQQSIDNLDLSQFISQLRQEILPRREGSPAFVSSSPSSVTEVAAELKTQGRLQVTENDLATLTGARNFPGRSEETLFGFSVRELSALDAAARVRAAERLEALRHPAAAPALATALHSETDSSVQVALLSALSSLAKAEAVPVVTPLLSSPAPEVRVAALKALLKVDATAAGPHLAAATKDPDKAVRRRASLLALGLAGSEALDLGRQAIVDADADVRALAALVLGASNVEAARPMLLDAMRDVDQRVRRTAAQSLSRLLGQDVTSLVALDDATLRREVRRIRELPIAPVRATQTSPRVSVSAVVTTRPTHTLSRAVVAAASVHMTNAPAAVQVMHAQPANAAPVSARASVSAELASSRVTTTVTTTASVQPLPELSSGILRELRAAMRGRPLHELSSGLNASQDDVMRACGELLSQGQIVRRGLKYFVA
jgi:hypothetical protein